MIYFLMVSLTFSLMEVAQYVAFKTSRTHFIGNESFQKQETEAGSEFTRLKNRFFKPSTNSWFELTLEDVNLADSLNDSGNLFLGTKLIFTSKVLRMAIPFLQDGRVPVRFEIASYLGREPSQEECIDFKQERADRIRSLGYRISNPSAVPIRQGNGC